MNIFVNEPNFIKTAYKICTVICTDLNPGHFPVQIFDLQSITSLINIKLGLQ